MASYRNISMDFWTDSKVVDDFTPEDRYIYLYCMTNPHTNLCGCYEVSIKQIANETGYNNDTVERLLKRLGVLKDFSGLQRIMLKVRPSASVPPISGHPPSLSANAAQSIQASAEGISDPLLRAALERLAKHAKPADR